MTRLLFGRQTLPLAVMTCWLATCVAGCTSTAPEHTEAGNPVPVDSKCSSLEAPKLTHRVEPRYPDVVRKEKWEGTVQVGGIIGTDGRVSEITVKSSPGKTLSDLVIEAVKQWRYTPAYCNDLGKPIRVYVTITSTFRLNRR